MGKVLIHWVEYVNAVGKCELFTELSTETVEPCLIYTVTAQFHRKCDFLSRFHSCVGEKHLLFLLSAISCSCSTPLEPLLTSPAPSSLSSTETLRSPARPAPGTLPPGWDRLPGEGPSVWETSETSRLRSDGRMTIDFLSIPPGSSEGISPML